MTPQPPPNQALFVENQEHTIAAITDTLNGNKRSFTVKQEVILLNPTTGERAFQTTLGLQRAIDGRLQTPDQSVLCRDCGRGPYAQPAIAYCTDCQCTIGKQCCVKDQNDPCCKSCRKKRFWRRVWQWVTSIGR